jgi:antirestriction protein ArdC
MKTKEKSGLPKDQRIDVYQMITDRIIEALEQGTIPWRKSWTGFGLAKNFITKRSYSGINAILTNLSPYPIPYFLTFKQGVSSRQKVTILGNLEVTHLGREVV